MAARALITALFERNEYISTTTPKGWRKPGPAAQRSSSFSSTSTLSLNSNQDDGAVPVLWRVRTEEELAEEEKAAQAGRAWARMVREQNSNG